MYDVIIPVFGVTYACHAQHFIILRSVNFFCQITIGYYFAFSEYGADIVRIGKHPESFFVFVIYIEVTVFTDPSMVWEMGTHRRMLPITRIGTITDCVVGININVIHASVIGRHGRNHTVQVFLMLFPRKDILRNIRDKDNMYATIGFCFCIMAEIIHPANSSILANDPILHKVHPVRVGFYLLSNVRRNPLIIFRVNQALKRKSGVCFEVFQICTAVYVEYGFVRIDQCLRSLRQINKESAGHMTADLFNNREGLLI